MKSAKNRRCDDLPIMLYTTRELSKKEELHLKRLARRTC